MPKIKLEKTLNELKKGDELKLKKNSFHGTISKGGKKAIFLKIENGLVFYTRGESQNIKTIPVSEIQFEKG